MKHPEFIYFDLGRVLLDFDPLVLAAQVAEACGRTPDRIVESLFASKLLTRYERGDVSSEEFYEELCRLTGARPTFEALALAASDIFTLRSSMLPIIANLRQAGYRLGILSNTCDVHWNYCVGRYPFLTEMFDVHALSFQLKSAKPDPDIFLKAAALAGAPPSAIFFTDDVEGHIAGARSVGIDAVPYVSASQIAGELAQRGIQWDY
jgi:FMN phosphatase YigB (HAD superfamily)